jgi:hypothetical protein
MTEKSEAKAAAKAAAKPEEPKTVRVVCMARGGRRRGGRGWDEGETLVPEAEMTAALRKALKADPMFQIG